MELKSKFKKYYFKPGSLLIAPYGIEICEKDYEQHQLEAFNRTIWN